MKLPAVSGLGISFRIIFYFATSGRKPDYRPAGSVQLINLVSQNQNLTDLS